MFDIKRQPTCFCLNSSAEGKNLWVTNFRSVCRVNGTDFITCEKALCTLTKMSPKNEEMLRVEMVSQGHDNLAFVTGPEDREAKVAPEEEKTEITVTASARGQGPDVPPTGKASSCESTEQGNTTAKDVEAGDKSGGSSFIRNQVTL